MENIELAPLIPKGVSRTLCWLMRTLLLGEVDGLTLHNVQQRLRRLQDLHVRSFRLLDRLVVLVARLRLAHQGLVDLLQTIGQHGQFLLDLAFVFFLLQDLLVQLFAGSYLLN